jgi:hypothetical protein
LFVLLLFFSEFLKKILLSKLQSSPHFNTFRESLTIFHGLQPLKTQSFATETFSSSRKWPALLLFVSRRDWEQLPIGVTYFAVFGLSWLCSVCCILSPIGQGNPINCVNVWIGVFVLFPV